MAQAPREYRQVVFSGLVQGVGFRPSVRKMALEAGVSGWVKNAGGNAECAFVGDHAKIDALIRAIEARFSIFGKKASAVEPFQAEGFDILESGGAPSGAALPRIVPPDAPVCDDCLREMYDPENRRHRHPFISCSACGPRYSILKALPYDRATTTMGAFPMCKVCAGEYARLADRRLHAQTIACPDCGPRLWYERAGAEQPDPIACAARDILAGGIVAVKGIGGYHLTCLAQREPAERLRRIKGREGKPFALMFRAMEDIEAVCRVSPEARALVTGFARPIALLPLRGEAFDESVTRGSLDCGCFLPYTPVHHLLMDAVAAGGARALIMTSMNRSGEPLICDGAAARAFAPGEIAGILDNDRPIANPLDDSVARVMDGAPQILRRARGYAPLPLPLPGAGNLVAAGGDLKAACCYLQDGCAYLGPYVGDLEDERCHGRYAAVADGLGALLGARPALAAADMHPRYFSRIWAQRSGLPVVPVQHHHAHVASVMAEYGLTRAVGAAFDGTGYGPDGTVWGGEFLYCEGGGFVRAAHLLPVVMAGGDESMRDAEKTAACYWAASGLMPAYAGWDVLGRAIERGINTVRSSSMGRLFDAASAILGICRKNGYEGECAILLEQAATLALRSGVRPRAMAFEVYEEGGVLIADWRPVIRALSSGGDVPALALGFHEAVARLTERVLTDLAARRGVKDAALTGGVFQNRLLTELCLTGLRARGLNPLLNRQVPPGDGGISLGQAFIASR